MAYFDELSDEAKERERGGEDMTQPAKHTPGPWKVTGEELVTVGDQELFHRIIRDENERWTALVEIEDREGEANAHLIAAAPAMYEALKASLLAIPDGMTSNTSPICQQIRAALAQAEGKQ